MRVRRESFSLIRPTQRDDFRYQKLLDQITYPPTGKINLPNGTDDISRSCDLFDEFYSLG